MQSMLGFGRSALNFSSQQLQQSNRGAQFTQPQLSQPQAQLPPSPPATESTVPSLHNIIIKNRWKILETVGKGAFGEVYLAFDMDSLENVAIKVESPLCKKQVLKLEISVMRKLQGKPHIACHIANGRFTWPHNHTSSSSSISQDTLTSQDPPVYSYLVMELLGSNLSELRKKCPNGIFSIATTALLGKQMLRSIQVLHEIGILHRDIKPGNFCMSQSAQGGRRQTLYLIDFGLSRRFLSSNGKVREPRSKVGFRGTARYASINAHLGLELGRTDDLWSLFYLLVEFLKGQLPWKGKEKEKIGELKQKYTSHELVAGLPSPMTSFFEHLTSLSYYDTPNYDYIHNLLCSLFEASGQPENVVYDWEILSEPVDTIMTEKVGKEPSLQSDAPQEDLSKSRNDVNSPPAPARAAEGITHPAAARTALTHSRPPIPDSDDHKFGGIPLLRTRNKPVSISVTTRPFDSRPPIPHQTNNPASYQVATASESLLAVGGSIDANTLSFSQSLSQGPGRESLRREYSLSPTRGSYPNTSPHLGDSRSPEPMAIPARPGMRSDVLSGSVPSLMWERQSSSSSFSNVAFGPPATSYVGSAGNRTSLQMVDSPLSPDIEARPISFVMPERRSHGMVGVAMEEDDVDLDPMEPSNLPQAPIGSTQPNGSSLLSSSKLVPHPPDSEAPQNKPLFRARRYQKYADNTR